MACLGRERDDLQAQLAAALKERDEALRAERDRLLAALEPTDENIQAMIDEYCKQNGYKLGINWFVGRVPAVIRAKVELP